jgi:hypothetical protein
MAASEKFAAILVSVGQIIRMSPVSSPLTVVP